MTKHIRYAVGDIVRYTSGDLLDLFEIGVVIGFGTAREVKLRLPYRSGQAVYEFYVRDSYIVPATEDAFKALVRSLTENKPVRL